MASPSLPSGFPMVTLSAMPAPRHVAMVVMANGWPLSLISQPCDRQGDQGRGERAGHFFTPTWVWSTSSMLE